MRIIHNLRTYVEHQKWYLAAGSTSEEFIFLSLDTDRRIVRTPADGWTREDADSFHTCLMRWDWVQELG